MFFFAYSSIINHLVKLKVTKKWLKTLVDWALNQNRSLLLQDNNSLKLINLKIWKC